MQYATIRCNVKIIKLILNSGANINAENMFYWTALQVVDPSNCLKLVRLLADRGASLDACDGYHNHSPSSSIDGVFLRKGFIYSALSLTTKTQLYDLYI